MAAGTRKADRKSSSHGQSPAPHGFPEEGAGTSATQSPAETTKKDPLRRSRSSGLWVALVLLTAVLIALIFFIAQNTQRVEVAFLGWNGQTPLAVALLIAASAGLVLAATTATLRMWQVRRRVRRGGK